MTDTPRTDAQHAGNADDYYHFGCVDVDFTRELERENNRLRTALQDVLSVIDNADTPGNFFTEERLEAWKAALR